MASNPPLQVEDQTDDEDFFDKLVEDDFVGPKESDLKLIEGSDSDDPKALSNLMTMSDAGNESENLRAEIGSEKIKEEEKESANVDGGVLDPHTEEKRSFLSSSSIGCDSVIQSSNEEIGSKSTSDSMASNSSGSVNSGIKEVGWSSFQNRVHGNGSFSDFFSAFADDYRDSNGTLGNSFTPEGKTVDDNNEDKTNDANNSTSIDYVQYGEGQVYGASVDQSGNGQDLSSTQYLENLYPGWKFDPISGQWYQLEGTHDSVSEGKTEISYMQQSAHSVLGIVPETSSTNESVYSRNQTPQRSDKAYPEYMVFDPQYPGWYYDTIAQEWRSLEYCNASIQSATQAYDQQNQNPSSVSGSSYTHSTNNLYSESYDISLGQNGGLAGSYDNTNQQSGTIANLGVKNYGGYVGFDNSYGSKVSTGEDQQNSFSSFRAVSSYSQASLGHSEANGHVGFLIPSVKYGQQYNALSAKENERMSLSHDYHSSQKSVNSFQQSFTSSHHQSSYGNHMERSSAGRPPHALVTFGFGGKLIVMKDNSSFDSFPYGSQDPVGSSVSVLSLMEVIMGNTDTSNFGVGIYDYFRALCQESFPGPLAGGSVGNKEMNKWIDERIANCGSTGIDCKRGEVLKLLLNLLKIAWQHYGKLRSPFGTDAALRENDVPELAVAKLFASAKGSNLQINEYGPLGKCLQNFPSEGQIQATASEVQNLLLSGRKKEALHCAVDGHLWGPALVLASQIGDQFYVDAVKQMALCQLAAGSPLRTLCLLIAGQPAEVFAADTASYSNSSGVPNMTQYSPQLSENSMLDSWVENLAVMTANRTKDDELAIIHLGGCLWKERSEILAAHICYLVAEVNFESYSDTARLCLVGADHWKFPRTYSTPQAIQRTELYEYSKVLGNSQFVLLPFQPYKLIYAHMLAEVGKISDSLKYCQAVLKSLKTGRAPEVDVWKQLVSSLEERIKTHQQGGYNANLAPAKLVGKLLNFFDSTAQRVVGGSTSPNSSTGAQTEQQRQQLGLRVSASQSTMAMSSLTPSASVGSKREGTDNSNRMIMHNRSVSEPDFGRTPRQDQVDPAKSDTSAGNQGKALDSEGASRFSRFGFGSSLLQKTVGLVLRPRSDRQAKLGEKNKFYYDDKLKRWVEEGAEPPAEEAAPPPPPTTASFQNGLSDYNLKSSMKKEGSPNGSSPEYRSPIHTGNNLGIPPIAPSSNQSSTRGRTGVRSRYVDTFNQGGGTATNLFQSPSVPSIKPTSSNTKFFVPGPALPNEQTAETIPETSSQDHTTPINEQPSTSTVNGSFNPHTRSITPMTRFPSMENLPSKEVILNGNITSHPHHSRRASWSGPGNDSHSPSKLMPEIRPFGEALGMFPTSTALAGVPSLMRVPINGLASTGFGDDLHEMEL